MQKSDSKDCEQSQQLNPINPISCTYSNNHHKFFKLGEKIKSSNYKYNQPKITSLFAHNHPCIQYTKARVTFSDNSPSNTTFGTNTSSNTEKTPSSSFLTTNRFFSKKLIAILTGKDAILEEARDCVLCNAEERLKDISSYIHSYWRDMSVIDYFLLHYPIDSSLEVHSIFRKFSENLSVFSFLVSSKTNLSNDIFRGWMKFSSLRR